MTADTGCQHRILTEGLLSRGYWDAYYNRLLNLSHRRLKNRLKEQARKALIRLLGERTVGLTASYLDYLLWNSLYKKYLYFSGPVKLLEIGSAPGQRLVKFHKVFGYSVYGVDYSKVGLEENKRIFSQNNIPAENLIFADFMQQGFQEKYRSFFDIVISMGVIEHYKDPRHIIEGHTNLLKDGGSLSIGIPNLRGFNYLLMRLFRGSDLAGHNLEIMQENKFRRLFDGKGLSELFCGFFGTLSVDVVTPLYPLQRIINLICRVLLYDKGLESNLFSPALLYIGKKGNLR